DQPAQSSRDGQVHPFPYDLLRLGIAVGVAVVVEDLDQPDPRFGELQPAGKRVIVATLVDLVPLERRPYEHRQRQLTLTSHDVSKRKHRPRTCAFAAGADNHDDGVVLDESDDLVAAFFQSTRRKGRVVPRPETVRRGLANQEAFFLGYLRQ